MTENIPKNDLELAYRQVNTYNEYSTYASRERFRNLATVSALSAGLLVVATFGDGLLEMTCFVKILLTILLLIIPVSLLTFIYELSKGEDNSHKMIVKITKEKVGDSASEEIKSMIKPSFTGLLTLILPILLSVIILVITVLIWV